MDSSKRWESENRYAVGLIRWKARGLVGDYGLTEQDREDIEQELLLELWERLPRFDPELSTHRAFVWGVVNNKVASIIRDRTLERQDYRLCACSLNERCKCDEEPQGQELLDSITEEQVRERLGLFSSSSEDVADLRMDVRAVLAQLPPDLRWLCERLMVRTVTEIHKETGIAHSTIRRRKRKLRSEFESKGFGTTI